MAEGWEPDGPAFQVAAAAPDNIELEFRLKD